MLDSDTRFVKADRCWCGWTASKESSFSEFYFECERCGTHFSKFLLKPDEIAGFYSYQNYWQDRQRSKAHPILEERKDIIISDGRIQKWKKSINRYLPDGDHLVLDIGCAEASLLLELKENGWKTIGIEPDPTVARIVRENTGLDIRQGVFPREDIPICDLIVACDVFEHVGDPNAFLKHVSNALKPEGILFIQLPILESDAGFDHMNSRVFDPEEHAFIYTRRSIATLLSANGFDIIENNDAWRIAHEIVVARKRPANRILYPKLLANLEDAFSRDYTNFVNQLNRFAEPLGLRVFTNWSKIWEYPRLWYDQLHNLKFDGLSVLDIGSEQSPWPWFLASKGAHVTIIETSENWVEQWHSIKDKLKVNVTWEIVDSCSLPLPSASMDLVTSFSVLEHQEDKNLAINEIIRVLKRGGLLGISFDLIFENFNMTYPEWNGEPWTLADCQRQLLNQKDLTGGDLITVNTDDIASFLDWHRATAPHHNYTCGAIVLKKASRPSILTRFRQFFK